jgi:O-acetyl-ADP-ribose deacetylase (regulator of RNase III)
MLRFTTGNLFDSDVDALVNTVNTVGVMGKGIALMFKASFPENFRAYRLACTKHEVAVGRMFVTQTGQMCGPKWIINFPTKQHWRDPSRLEWIADGLQDLRRVILQNGIRSIAIPALGAGNGGLEWLHVQRMIQDALSDLDGIDMVVFEPAERSVATA